MRTRLIPTSLLTLSLALVGTTATVAQDAPELEPEVTYSTGSVSGEIAAFIPPADEVINDGLRQMWGRSIVGVPVEMGDPRVSGQLSFVANGAGQDFENGFTNIESRTYRLENEGGVWTGSGSAVLAVSDEEALIDMETAVLVGEGDYDGLVAYLYAEPTEDNRAFEIVVVQGEPAALPEPVSATAIADATAG